MRPLIIITDPPDRSDKPYHALRLARALARQTDEPVHVVLLGDAVGCAVAGHQTPDGYEKIERMLSAVARHGGVIGCCGQCLDDRGISDDQLIDPASRCRLDELATWTEAADHVLVFGSESGMHPLALALADLPFADDRPWEVEFELGSLPGARDDRIRSEARLR